jgi:hypothetical protein
MYPSVPPLEKWEIFSFFLSKPFDYSPLEDGGRARANGRRKPAFFFFLFLRRMNFDPSVVSREKEAHEFLRVEKQQQLKKKKERK